VSWSTLCLFVFVLFCFVRVARLVGYALSVDEQPGMFIWCVIHTSSYPYVNHTVKKEKIYIYIQLG
jgi:hypothetical protein